MFSRFVSQSARFFFFSSRRRHTRFDCDWSSDVCSSDLARGNVLPRAASAVEGRHGIPSLVDGPSSETRGGRCCSPSRVAPQTGRRQSHGCSDARCRTAVKPCYRKSLIGHGLGNDIRPWRSLVDARWLLSIVILKSGYPPPVPE